MFMNATTQKYQGAPWCYFFVSLWFKSFCVLSRESQDIKLRHDFFIPASLSVTMKSKNDDDFSEEMHSSFEQIMNAPDAFVAVDYDLRFLFVNKLAEKFYKKNKSELLGQSLYDVYPKEMEFGPFKAVIKNVQAKKHFEFSYQSPFVKEWVKLVGRPFENYYTFTYRTIDYKEVLKEELRKEMKKRK
jgi:PAS domain-containing protein